MLFLIAGAALGLSAKDQATAQMAQLAEEHNAAMSQVFLKELWPHSPVFFAESDGSGIEAINAAVETILLREKVIALIKNSEILVVNFYSRDGRSVFSSNENKASENHPNHPGFISALGGTPASTLLLRSDNDDLEKPRFSVDVFCSQFPVRDDGAVSGVIELCQNVTPFVNNLNQVLIEVMSVGALVMLALYLLQLIVVRYAQTILHTQETALIDANRELDFRVDERTHELATINCQLEGEMLERRHAETQLEHLAHHDPLTGLPNRLLFTEQLQRSLSNAQRHQKQLAVLFIDLDRFKEVNDTLGHAVGDELLVEVGQRLSGQLRGGDLLARLGGDEFVCILESIETPDEASSVAEKLIARVARPAHVRSHELNVSASVGISVYPADGENLDDLLRAADTAMYQAKRHGRNTYHFYTPEMTRHAVERAKLERVLRHAIDNNELDLHYQIKIAAGKGHQPVGVEALLRWNSPQLGRVSPVQFIPIAEETGFIVELGAWVLRRACEQMVAWRVIGVQIPSISVNVSVRQLERNDFLSVVQTVLTESGLPPDALELEITESVIMHVEDAIDVLEQLNTLGVRMAIDDFGTGYSSLAYLKRLPIDTLKIDRSFVIGIGNQSSDESIIHAVIGMAQSMNLSTVAEGVETEAQLAFLQQAGCDQIQGYYFGKPQPHDEFLAGWRQALRPING
jgi:diguanylate cyclase (GGDEF)-like protein